MKGEKEMEESEEFESLEEALGMFADVIEDERNANWRKGDVALKVVNYFGSEVIGKLAETAHCSINKIYHLIYNARAFPPEKRAKDYNWTYHLIVGYRAKALEMDAAELLDMAIKNGWTMKDVKEYKSEKKSPSIGSFYCIDCDAKVKIVSNEDKKGIMIKCPFCGKDLGRMI
jgi:hypothetical protein